MPIIWKRVDIFLVSGCFLANPGSHKDSQYELSGITPPLEKLLTECLDVFQGHLGVFQGIKTSVSGLIHATNNFHCHRAVLFAIKAKLDETLIA